MTALPGPARAEAFFLDAAPGQRFCVFHPPVGACRGAILYVHPFGEEMNKSRRMAALQARALAGAGYGVLLIDLYGCGDSSGDFADARWDIWRTDLAAAERWLRARLDVPVSLWGLRLGATLALDYAARAAVAPEALVLWQPVQNGKTFLTQFLRLRVANQMLSDGADSSAGGTNALRQQLQEGAALEIAGYELAPELALAIDALDLARIAPAAPVHWCEAVSAAGRELPPGARRVTDAWRAAGATVEVHVVPCPAFWATQEITESPDLLELTSAIFSRLAP